MAKQYKICQTCGSKVPAEKKEVRYVWINAITGGPHFCHKNCNYLYPHGRKGYRCEAFGEALYLTPHGMIQRSYKCECQEIKNPYADRCELNEPD